MIQGFLYKEKNGKHILYLGGFTTVAGLKLFANDALVSKVKIHSDQPISNLPNGALGISSVG